MDLDDLFPPSDLNDDATLYRVNRENKEATFQRYLRMDPISVEDYQEMVRLLDDLGMTVAIPMIQAEQARQGTPTE